MIKNKDSMPYRKPVLDLTGPDGNAYAILGYASNFSKQLNLNYEEIRKEMTSSDYENLIEVFDKYFGEYIDLVR
jgi:hypothetical protein